MAMVSILELHSISPGSNTPLGRLTSVQHQPQDQLGKTSQPPKINHPCIIMHRMGGGAPNAQSRFCTLACTMCGFLASVMCGLWSV